MADYWKSQPRKFCEVCKCWFGDNKASIDFHERGKRHKENVQRQLREARINAADQEKEKAKTTGTLQAIERAAMKAYQRDLEVQAGLPLSREARLISQDEVSQQKEEQVSGHKQIDFSAFQMSAPPSSTTVTPPSPPVAPPPPPSQWQQLTSPEGYWYYYNVITGVSQWEPPPEFQQPQQEQRQHQAGAPSTAAVTTTTEGVNSNTDTATVTTEERGHKRSADEADLEKREVYQRPKIVERPYGQWTTVAVRSQEPDEDKDGVERNSEKEREKSGSDSSDNEDSGRSEKGVKYFQEKTLPSSSGTVVSGSFKGFGFKKRPGGGGMQKRPQIRQRTSEL